MKISDGMKFGCGFFIIVGVISALCLLIPACVGVAGIGALLGLGSQIHNTYQTETNAPSAGVTNETPETNQTIPESSAATATNSPPAPVPAPDIPISPVASPSAPDTNPAPTSDTNSVSVPSPAPETNTVAPGTDTNPPPATDTNATAAPDQSSTPPVPALAEAELHGTADTYFGKDWVIVDGVKLTGISLVNPVPDAQVALVYSDGGKNVPAKKLPQGFLDEWKITPESLRSINAPPSP